MSWPASFFFPHEVIVRDLVSAGGMGIKHGLARTVACEVKDEQTLVRNKDGAEVVSSTNITVDISESIPLGSLVTVWAGTPSERVAEVLASARNLNAAPLQSYVVLSLK